MGLAPYGEPIYADVIREKLIDLKEDGSFRMDMSYFNYCQGLTMTSPKFDAAVRRPAAARRSRRSTQREMDMAASIQKVTEEIMLRAARHVHARTGHEEPVPGRRRGAELRGQRPDSARRAVRDDLDSAGRRRRRRGTGHGAVHLAPTAGQPAQPSPRDIAARLAVWARSSTTDEIAQFARRAGGAKYRDSRATRHCAATWPS